MSITKSWPSTILLKPPILSLEKIPLIFRLYPLKAGLAFWGNNVKVLPSRLGHLSEISLIRMATSANNIILNLVAYYKKLQSGSIQIQTIRPYREAGILWRERQNVNLRMREYFKT
jgi:hypothetical protein